MDQCKRGLITVETANNWIDERAARQHDMPEGQYLSVCVTDTGTGMSPEVIAGAFEPFLTTKPAGEGTDFGLSMIYGFANQSEGQARVYLPRHYGDVAEEDNAARIAELPQSERNATRAGTGRPAWDLPV